jgi:hypothetical protein
MHEIRQKVNRLEKSYYPEIYSILCCRYLDLNIILYNLDDLSALISNKVYIDKLLDHNNFYIEESELTIKHFDLIYELIKRKKIKAKSEYFAIFPYSSMIELLIRHGLDPNYNNGILAILIVDKHAYYTLRDSGLFNLRSRNDYLLYRMVDHPHIFYELINKYQLDPSIYSNEFVELFTSYTMPRYISNSNTIKYILGSPNVLKSLNAINITRLKKYIIENDYNNKDTYPVLIDFSEDDKISSYNLIFKIILVVIFLSCIIYYYW